MINKNKTERNFSLIFTFARIITVFTRTALLFLVIMLDEIGLESKNLALLLTIGPTLILLTNLDYHQDYYKLFFSDTKTNFTLAKNFSNYTNFYFGFVPILYITAVIILFFLFKSFFISFLYAIVVSGEKIYDEFQRFTIFNKNYKLWSLVGILEFVTPALITILSHLLFETSIVNTYVAISAVVNLLMLSFIIIHSKYIYILRSKRFKWILIKQAQFIFS